MTPSVRRSRIRPARPLSPFVVSILVLLVWWAVAHNSGSGWVQALGDVVFGMLAIGTLGPAIALRRVRLELVHAPPDSTAGMPAPISIRASSRVRVHPLQPGGMPTLIGPHGRGADDRDITLLPAHRGVHDDLTIEVSTAAPFGIQWWSRRITFPLPAPLHVAPRLGQPITLPHWFDKNAGQDGQPLPSHAGDIKGVREYRAGDRRRRVHWPATAHAGRLMVREMEEPAARPLTLDVRLPQEADQAERLAECALATAVHLLDRGSTILLATVEPEGRIVGEVRDRRDAGRRLARAIGVNGTAGIELSP